MTSIIGAAAIGAALLFAEGALALLYVAASL